MQAQPLCDDWSAMRSGSSSGVNVLISSCANKNPLQAHTRINQHYSHLQAATEITYMQDLLPPRNVMLQTRIRHQSYSIYIYLRYSQIGVNSGNSCIINRFRKRSKPSFRSEFENIFSPDCLTAVAAGDSNHNFRTFWHKYFTDQVSIDPDNRLWKLEDIVFASSLRQGQSFV